MSTHGRSGIGRWVYGSVTDKVLRGSATPVLLVRVQEQAEQIPIIIDLKVSHVRISSIWTLEALFWPVLLGGPDRLYTVGEGTMFAWMAITAVGAATNFGLWGYANERP